MKQESWVILTKRTNEPKLSWITKLLKLAGIQSKRRGESAHAPILVVRREQEGEAWDLLWEIDNIADDAKCWNTPPTEETLTELRIHMDRCK